MFSDVDILVRPDDLDRTLAALLPITAIGAPVLPGRVRTRAWQEWQITDVRGASIDVHHAVAGSLVTSRLPVEMFFDRPIDIKVGGRRLRTPDPAVSFVHSVMHLTTGGRRLSTIPDLLRLASLVRPTDDRLLELLQGSTTNSLLLWGLDEAAKWVDLPEPWEQYRTKTPRNSVSRASVNWVQRSEARMSLANTFLGKHRVRRLGETLWPTQEFLDYEGVSRLGNYGRLLRKGLGVRQGEIDPAGIIEARSHLERVRASPAEATGDAEMTDRDNRASTDDSFLQFSLRSRAIGPRNLSENGRRQLVCLVPANGTRGRLLQLATLGCLRIRLSGRLRPLSEWPLPVSKEEWLTIATDITDREPDTGGFLWHLPPPDQVRPKFSALGLDRTGRTATSFVRVTPTDVAKMSPTLERGRRSAVSFPMRLGAWKQGEWSVERTAVVLVGRHRAVRLDLSSLMALIDDVQEALGGTTPPVGCPAHWRPAHGDMTFWNIRRDSRGRTALIDWEEAAWAPPHADLVRYIATARNAKTLVESVPNGLRAELAEAIDYWELIVRPAEGESAWARRTVEGHRRSLALLRNRNE